MVGSASSTSTTEIVGKIGQLDISDNPTKAALVRIATILSVESSEVNYVQTNTPKTSQQPMSKKRNNNNCCKKNSSIELTGQTNQDSNARGSQSKQKI